MNLQGRRKSLLSDILSRWYAATGPMTESHQKRRQSDAPRAESNCRPVSTSQITVPSLAQTYDVTTTDSSKPTHLPLASI